jgi:general nucleoside transport system permease protein
MSWIEIATALLASGIRLSMPIGIAAIGEVVTERSGIINVGIEGVMLMSAFLAVFGSVVSGSPWGGLAAALLGGAAFSALHAFFTIRLRVDQIVTGIAIVILCLGLSGLFFRLSIGNAPVAVYGFEPLIIYPLNRIPLIGPALFEQSAPVYLCLALAAITSWGLANTRLGLEVRAVGENPEAVEAAGISVAWRRAMATVFGGTLAGLGGATLAITGLNNFIENMIAGRGFIAVACVVFGRWRPLGGLAAAFGFGLTEAIEIRLQIWLPDVPYQLLVILPYVVAVVALVLLGHSAQSPKALGQPFRSAQP